MGIAHWGTRKEESFIFGTIIVFIAIIVILICFNVKLGPGARLSDIPKYIFQQEEPIVDKKIESLNQQNRLMDSELKLL